MEIVCIYNKKNGIVYPFTINKKYTILPTISRLDNCYFIKGDDNFIHWYPKMLFLPLNESIIIKIKKIKNNILN